MQDSNIPLLSSSPSSSPHCHHHHQLIACLPEQRLVLVAWVEAPGTSLTGTAVSQDYAARGVVCAGLGERERKREWETWRGCGGRGEKGDEE